MPVELNIVESVTELDTTVVTVVLESASEPGPAGPGVPAGGDAGQVLTKDSGTDYDTSWQDPTGGGGGAPTDADYLVGTANGSLSNEIVVGTSPGGELGGTWASPTVDATHSGSSHASVQAAAEATAAAALSAHDADTTGIHGIPDTSALLDTGDIGSTVPAIATFNDHSARHEDGGADEIDLTGLSGTPAALTTHEADTTSVHGIADTSALLDTADIGVTVQAFDADLSTYAGITPSANVQSLLGAANYAAMRSLLSLVVGTNVQAWDADLDTYAGITPSANVQSLLAAANYAAMRALLDLEAGTDFPSLTTFNDHSARHENGGGDEISVAGLSGELADAQPLDVRKNSTGSVFTRSRLNFIEGTNVTLTVADDAGNDEVDITIAASGSGGGDADLTPAFAFGGY